ncbi:conserved hypothetical protein [Leishmania major strain Friedlin]|uniref:Uncharacterized protein n=1 Tax=Leishmania major TaxID=5664 RepID=Q4QBD5_LEIMA|nr:conserved hypothetical protein [Leishmania major strain Friedlin]CAG9574152.1 hypothetical_protein_-_conserved [Leishmania major strain Friedlin]CAJ04068.1 conserved hypothetical protein [Leishmania major strain Friedlin]|eukprot:XP_001683363.1 conserved hypothetical protein [Leishmania major strain Friedlin]
MSRQPNEDTFGAALANEFQWRNLYLKEFGCCTYPPPIPKDPSTTAVGVYPMRRQVKLLQQESSSSSEDADNEVEEDDHYEESTNDTDGDDSYQANFSSGLFQFSFSGGDSDGCHSRKHQSHNVDLADAEPPSTSCSRRDRSTADQFFSLDLSMSVGEDGASTHTSRHPSHHSGGRRCGHGAVLRKDDFFDTNDVFSTKFFSFLWMGSDNDGHDEEYSSETRTVDHEVRRWGARDPDNGRGIKSSMRSTKNPGRLTLSRPGFSTVTSHAFNTNPQGVPEVVLRLHHQTWILLMDNRLMAWVHRAATDHCQRATQLRQRLLEIIALGPCSADIAGDAALASPTQVRTSLVLPEEDALQRTLESFSPFFVVIAPPPAVQRAKDQFRAAQRGQLRSGNGQQAAAASVADLIGLPLLSQYGSWREAYEHRHRWDKAPFSFFFIHDVSYNYAQVTALFVQLQLLYTHSHSHSRRCAEAKRESVPLKSASRQFATSSTASRTPEERRHVCPLLLMQEMTENVVLAYEQSSARSALPMLRRVLDFLTDAALDVVTAHRFISRKAVLRQHQFQLPGMTTVRPLPVATRASAATAAVAAAFDMSQATEEDGSADAAEDRRLTSRSLDVSKEGDGAPMKDELSGTDGSGIPISGVEPKRVTESDINALFEIAYWFADVTTANASVPLDPAPPAGMTAGQSAARAMPPNTSLEALKKMSRSSPASTPPLDTPTDRAGTNHSAAAAAGGGGAALPMYKVLSVEESQLSSPPNSNALSMTGAGDSSLSSLTSRSQQYLPGRVQVHNPVESLAEAVALLEAYRKPQQLRDDRPGRGGRRKRHSVSFDPRARSGGAGAKGSALPSLTPIPVSDSFISFISPLVVLTTYLRLHGGTWLKHLCRRVFESLRRPNVLLYVNTLELDAAWASLQLPSSLSSQETTKASVAAATRGRQRLLNRSISSTPLAPSTAASAEAARSEFLHGLGCLEDLICQDILCALNNFFGFLYGKRAAAARLPQGISILLTQFVSTVHLYMLESVGATRAAAAAAPGNGNRNRSMRPGSHPSPSASGGATAADAPSRIVEDCLRMCKQRYYAGLRQHGSANEWGEAYVSAFRNLDGPLKSFSDGTAAEATASTASLPRLLHTIEQHRLAKFILFDCWILPALNNAIALGYLASDSPMHLRWNVDALARYLKILVHAPFVEQDKTNFSSLFPEVPRGSSRRSTGHPRSNDVRDGKGGRGADKQPGSGRPPSQGDGRGAGRPTVLTLPPYLTGIYDVATGSLVRLQTSIPMTATAGDNWSKRMSSAAAAAEHPTALSAPSSTLSSSMSTVAHGESVHSEALSPRYTDQSGEDVSAVETPTQEGQSKWTLEATALPSSATATHEPPPRAAPQQHFKVQQAAAANESTVTPQSASSSRLFFIAGESVEAAADMSSPGTHRDTGSFAGSPKDVQGELPMGSRGKISDAPSSSITPALTSPHASPPPPLNRIQSIFSSADQRATGAAVAMTHPYVVMDDAVWLDMSPALQNLNDCIGLTFCDRGTGEAFAGDTGTVAAISRLPTISALSGHADSRTGATTAHGAAGQRASGALRDCSTFVDLALFDVPALEMLNAFTYAACTDDSSYVVVSEFEVLPSMAAGCLERIYELATDTHPMVLHALQKGAFHFAYNDSGSVPSGLTSLYTACMNGVLLHPRTAAHVLKNVMDNNPPFSHTLLKPVADTTALDLLGHLATHSRDVPMVDVNAVVPLIHSMVPDRNSSGGGGRRVHARTDAANSGMTLPAVGAPNTSTTSSATVSHRWERESRRLLRELVFLTTGNSDSGPPLPLAPGLRRPVGPPHPIHMLRAGAARIAEDTGGMTPMVFDPWWRAMVVALCVKASNVFAECSGNQPVLFQDMCNAQAEESKRLNRYTIAHFVNTKGRETCEKDAVAMMSGSQQRPTSISGRGSYIGDLPAWPGRKRKRRPKARGVTASVGGKPASIGRKSKKKGRKAAAAAA